MKSKFYIAAAICLLLGAGCGCREKCSGDYYDYTPDPPRSYFFFPEGSWWAYENSVTGEIDTLTASPTSGYLIQSSHGAGSPTCVEGYSESQAFNFNNKGFLIVNMTTRDNNGVDIRIELHQHSKNEFGIGWRKDDNSFYDRGNNTFIKLDTIFSPAFERSFPTIKCLNTAAPSDTAWFSINDGLIRLSQGDTALVLKEYKIS